MVDLLQHANDHWGLRGALLQDAATTITTASHEFVQARYPRIDLLESAQRFIAYDLLDSAPGHVEAHRRIGYFPWVEAAGELDRSLSLAWLGMYRGAFDHQRRGLELAAVGALFVSDHTPREEARAWMRSELTTPMFSRALDRIARHGVAARLEAAARWTAATKSQYRMLSDIIHVRGEGASSWKVQPVRGRICGVTLPAYNEAALGSCLDAFCVTVGHVALLVTLANPVALFDFPLESKFGLNGPLSGFLEGAQVDRLRQLLPDALRTQLIALAECDPEVAAVRHQIEEMPDITEAEVREQIRTFDEQFGVSGSEADSP